jgi:hypothetical protein
MFVVNGCWKRNSFSTSLVAAAAVDILDYWYICIGDDGGGSGYA